MSLHEPGKPDGPVRVLVVSDHLGGPGGGVHGATTYFLNVLPRFDRARVTPTVCFLRERHPAAEQLEAAGVRPFFLDRPKWDPRALTDLVKRIRSDRCELVHAAGMKAILLGRVAARMAGCPALIHLHDAKPLDPVLGFLQRRLARDTARAIVVSDVIVDFAVEAFQVPRDRVEVVYNGLDLEVFARPPESARQRVRDELQVDADTPLVAVPGRIVPEKGQAELIRAMSALRDARRDVRLLVVGEGPGRPDCESLVARLGLRDSVRFCGQRSDMPSVLAAVDVVVVPSMWEEPFGFAALEALAAGTPVVAFDSGALPKLVVDGESGLLVPRGDVAALARALARVLGDRGLHERLGQGGRRRAEKFSVQRHVERLEEIYRAVARPVRSVSGGRASA